MGCHTSKTKNIKIKEQKNITINISYKELIINDKNNDNEENINGLENLGNTCYINSIMQCLMKISPLCNYFLSDLHLYETNDKNNWTISNYFGEMIKIYHKNNQKVIKYYDFLEYLIKKYNNIHEYEQEDAHEFMVFLLDSIHEDLNRCKNKHKIIKLNSFYINQIKEKQELMIINKVAKQHWKNYLNSNKSIIIDLFQGQTKDIITCKECNINKINFESIMYFSLPINENKNYDILYNLLKNFSKEEKLEKDNQYFCEKCNKKTDATKKTIISKFPPILIIHFKRFKYNNYDQEKLNNFIDFPINNLDLTKLSLTLKKNQPKYNLFGVLNHKGTLDNGHYYSYTYEKLKQKWYKFNDSQFNVIEENELATKNAYILFYFKNTIKSVKKQAIEFPQNWPISNRNISFKKTIIENYKII